MVAKDDVTPSCSVIICTRDRPAELDRCLEAVSHLTYSKFDVLVVANVPKDTRSQEVARRWGVRYVVEPLVGVSRVRNCGARSCDAEILAYLDDDFVPAPDWLAALVVEFADPKVMAVAGQICALKTETEIERLCAAVSGSHLGGHERLVVDFNTSSWFELANFGGIVPGGNMAFRRSAFNVMGGFDERLGRGTPLHGGEEPYAFFSLIDRGHRVVYTPYAIIRHPYPSTIAELSARDLNALTASTAYMTLLLVEQPRYRRAVLKYIMEGLRGTERTWRGQVVKRDKPIVSRWRRVVACLTGPFIYTKFRMLSRRL